MYGNRVMGVNNYPLLSEVFIVNITLIHKLLFLMIKTYNIRTLCKYLVGYDLSQIHLMLIIHTVQ